MRAANIATAIAVVLWSCLALGGRGLVGGVAARMGGSASLGQVDYYVLTPVYVVVALLACAWGCNTFRRAYWVLGAGAGFALVGILPFLLPYSGGM